MMPRNHLRLFVTIVTAISDIFPCKIANAELWDDLQALANTDPNALVQSGISRMISATSPAVEKIAGIAGAQKDMIDDASATLNKMLASDSGDALSPQQADEAVTSFISRTGRRYAKLLQPDAVVKVVDTAESVASHVQEFEASLQDASDKANALYRDTFGGAEADVLSVDQSERSYLETRTDFYGDNPLPDVITASYIEAERVRLGLESTDIRYEDENSDLYSDTRTQVYGEQKNALGDDTTVDNGVGAGIPEGDPLKGQIDSLISDSAANYKRNVGSAATSPVSPGELAKRRDEADRLASNNVLFGTNRALSIAGTSSRVAPVGGSDAVNSPNECGATDPHSLDCATIKRCTQLQIQADDDYIRSYGSSLDASTRATVERARSCNARVMNASCDEIYAVIDELRSSSTCN